MTGKMDKILTLGSSFWRFAGGGPSASWSMAEYEDDGYRAAAGEGDFMNPLLPLIG